MPEVLDKVDRHFGNVIEAANRRHHERRLRRIGWERAIRGSTTAWATGSFPVRDGNHVEVFIDGVTALPAIAEAVRSATSFVHVAGWTITPGFALERSTEVVTLRGLLAEAAERVDVRVLVWAGAPFHLFHPSRGESRASIDQLTAGTRIRGALDSRNRPMHCHHEKLVIIDGTLAFVGGIDLTDLGGDRFDGPAHDHTTGLGWHDAASSIAGPAVADVTSHFAMRWEATAGEHLDTVAAPSASGQSRVQVVRTVPEHTYGALRNGEFSILEAYVGALQRAERLVYLENQFLWSPEVVAILRDKLLHPPDSDFRVAIVLPSRPNNGGDDTRGQLGVLIEADRHRRLLAGTIGPPGRDRPSVYVHAKIAIVDDRWLTIGSANLNEHSLFNDTEVNVVTDDATLARATREQLWSEHLGEDCAGIDAVTLLETMWRPLLQRPVNPSAALRQLPSTSRRSARLLGPIKGLVVDG